ncbi:MAG: hypothetical protein OEW87_04725 [Flavobacteriaceae bacterium]|nr:hypothetical protein [Flavobacteriaceae bacterium]
MSKYLSITAPSRIHITLISMTDELYRKNGGVGFAINGFDVCIDAYVSKKNSIDNSKNTNIDNRTIIATINILDNAVELYSLKKSIEVKINKFPPQHSGFGSGTSFKLACLESLFLVNKVKLEDSKLAFLSGRGGTSGIGINTYFHGGFVFDLGRVVGPLLPSNTCKDFELPLVLCKLFMPEWEIGIYKPSSIQSLSHEQELSFFNKNCPIDKNSVVDLTHELVFSLVPSILEKNIINFSKSINTIQDSTWKKYEWDEYNNLFDVANSILHEDSYCFGLSSLGTACYFLANDKSNIKRKMNVVDPNGLIRYVTVNNTGRIVTYV